MLCNNFAPEKSKTSGVRRSDIRHLVSRKKQTQSLKRVNLTSRVNHGTTDLVRLYLQDIGRVPLLAREEEISLARKIQVYMGLIEIREEAETKNDSQINQLISLMDTHAQLTQQLGYPPTPKTWAAAMGLEESNLEQKLSASKTRWAELAGISVAELEKSILAGSQAKEQMIAANLRLVVSVAKRYQHRGIELLDLIQEGTLGLERAVEKFDPVQGCRFSTYSYWWIRQGITRAIATQSRVIRLPVHITEKLNKIKQAQRKITQKQGRQAKLDEIAEFLEMEPLQVREILMKLPRSVSLEIKVGGEQETELADLLESEMATPEETAVKEALREDIQGLLNDLNYRERHVIQLRYGFNDGICYSLADIGQRMELSRERVRQIEVRALQKLRHPRRRHLVQDYCDVING